MSILNNVRYILERATKQRDHRVNHPQALTFLSDDSSAKTFGFQ
jgi:hypothetical protein